jgi:hypothetical protein
MKNQDWLRITYYRYNKREKRWVFAGQTSYADPMSQFEEFFVNGIKEKDWIRKLFKNVFRQRAKELE